MQTPPQAPDGRPDSTGAPSLVPAIPLSPGGPGRPDVARPLPDPVAIQICAIPDAAPPYDDEMPAGTAVSYDDEVHAGTAPRCDPEGPAGPEGCQREAVRQGGSRPDGQGDAWPSKFAQVLAETLAGSRPPAQLTPWTTERARSHIRRLAPLLAAGQRPFVHRIVTSLPAADVMEVSIVVGFGPRVRALAIRLERAESRPASPGLPGRQARWLCTAVEAA